MSSSIVLALRVFGTRGTAEVLVMAAALGLFSTVARRRPAGESIWSSLGVPCSALASDAPDVLSPREGRSS